MSEFTGMFTKFHPFAGIRWWFSYPIARVTKKVQKKKKKKEQKEKKNTQNQEKSALLLIASDPVGGECSERL